MRARRAQHTADGANPRRRATAASRMPPAAPAPAARRVRRHTFRGIPAARERGTRHRFGKSKREELGEPMAHRGNHHVEGVEAFPGPSRMSPRGRVSNVKRSHQRIHVGHGHSNQLQETTVPPRRYGLTVRRTPRTAPASILVRERQWRIRAEQVVRWYSGRNRHREIARDQLVEHLSGVGHRQRRHAATACRESWTGICPSSGRPCRRRPAAGTDR